MQRAVVIRVHGDPDIGQAIASAVAQTDNGNQTVTCNKSDMEKELAELRVKVGVSNFRHSKDYRKGIDELHRKFPIKEHSERYKKFWGYVGLIWILLTEKNKFDQPYLYLPEKQIEKRM